MIFKRLPLFVALLISFPGFAADLPPFSFHLLAEPTMLDPQKALSPFGNYLLNNMYRGLMKYHDKEGLVPDGAKSCKHPSTLEVVCELRDRKWSNGTPIQASDYVKSFRRLIDPANSSVQVDVLFTLKNARAIWRKDMKPEQLGVVADSPHTLRFTLEFEDPEFVYRLIHPALAPYPPGGYLDPKQATKQVVSGPYLISEFKSKSWTLLKNNPNYDGRPRPPLKMFMIDDDSTALRLYESGKMTFLRRLTWADIPRLKTSKEFKQISVARFDYIGFGPALENEPLLREALVKSIDFNGFHKLFETRSSPGCPSMPSYLMDTVPCQKFDLARAKVALKQVKKIPKLSFHVSLMGGNDVARAAEWLQNQWKKNLGLNVEIKFHEQGLFNRMLTDAPPMIFRKGIGVDRPTCLAALETLRTGRRENYIRLADPKFETVLDALRLAPTEAERKVACRKAMEYVLSLNRIIPMGEMYFTIMAKPSFTGWNLNSLNQFDLSDLTYVPAKGS
jgi:oligopeptide transport system substrate-binding protein